MEVRVSWYLEDKGSAGKNWDSFLIKYRRAYIFWSGMFRVGRGLVTVRYGWEVRIDLGIGKIYKTRFLNHFSGF